MGQEIPILKPIHRPIEHQHWKKWPHLGPDSQQLGCHLDILRYMELMIEIQIKGTEVRSLPVSFYDEILFGVGRCDWYFCRLVSSLVEWIKCSLVFKKN